MVDAISILNYVIKLEKEDKCKIKSLSYTSYANKPFRITISANTDIVKAVEKEFFSGLEKISDYELGAYDKVYLYIDMNSKEVKGKIKVRKLRESEYDILIELPFH